MSTFVLILVFAGASTAWAQIPFRQADETAYTQGLTSFNQGDYATAFEYFDQVMGDSLNQRSAEAYYYGARSLFNMRQFTQAVGVIDTFLLVFPGDEHRYDMMNELGAVYFELGDYDSAAAQFVTVIDSASDRVVRDQAASSLRALVDSDLSFPEIESLFGSCHTRASSLIFALGFARRAYFSDRYADADTMLNEFKQRYPQPGTGNGEVEKWIARIAADSVLTRAPVKIGVLLPLEYGAGVGDRLLLGLQLALDEYNAIYPTKVGIVLENYGTSMVTLFRDMLGLCQDSSVKAVVGPVYSNEVSEVAGLADSNRLPLITPTATQVGLALDNAYVFQANPDFQTRARSMADYAVDTLHIRSIAILSPSDSYGREIAGYFVGRLRELGVTPVSMQYFPSGTTDLSQQIEQIKNDAASHDEPYVDFGKLNRDDLAMLRGFGVSPFLIDSLVRVNGSVDAYDLFGKNPIRVADSLGIPIDSRTSLGDFDALRSLGAVFVPLTSPKEIGVVGAQLAYYNVKTQLLGTDDWYDLNELSSNDPYIEGVIFCSDSYFNKASPAYSAVSDSLSQISDADLDRVVGYGYDVMNLLLSAINSGDTTRGSITGALKETTFDGLHSTISFRRNNSNHYIHILQFKNDGIVDLGEMDVK